MRGEIGKRLGDWKSLAAGVPLEEWRAEVQRKLRDLDREGVPSAGGTMRRCSAYATGEPSCSAKRKRRRVGKRI